MPSSTLKSSAVFGSVTAKVGFHKSLSYNETKSSIRIQINTCA